MPNDRLKGVDKLTPSDLLDGTMLYLEGKRFDEQAVYALLQEIEEQNPKMRGWFEIGGSAGNLRSEPVRGLLSFMESGKVVEIPPPNPVKQFYKLRGDFKDVVRTDLTERGILPKHEKLFRYLAERLENLSTEFAPTCGNKI